MTSAPINGDVYFRVRSRLSQMDMDVGGLQPPHHAVQLVLRRQRQSRIDVSAVKRRYMPTGPRPA
jgi:hypothetical protein